MPATEPSNGNHRRLPPMIVFIASVVIVFHLSALLLRVLASASGPWATSFGTTDVTPPTFAAKLDNITRPLYLVPLKMTHNYHFPTNEPEQSAVRFELVLRNADGSLIETLRYPDPDANFWVRHRQKILAQGLFGDQPVQLQQGEPSQAINRETVMIPIRYQKRGEKEIIVEKVPDTELYTGARLVDETKKNADPTTIYRLSDYSLILARSYARYVSRLHNAHSVELIRYTKDPIPPGMILMQKLPDAFAETVEVNFGELTK